MKQNVSKVVENIISDVKKNKDKALIKYTKKFDKFNLTKNNIVVSSGELKKALKSINKNVLNILKEAKANIYNYHKEQKRHIKPFVYKSKDTIIKENISVVDSVGVYIPGGLYPYPSSVFANVLPAVAAGVKNIYVVTPNGNLNNIVASALCLSGVTKVFRVGGAQAIAALAYSTNSIKKVDMIVGPGNKYVVEAKRQVYGTVGIDSLSGPSDVVILADNSANYKYVATDLMAQTEHDINAKAFLVTTSNSLMQKVKKCIDKNYKNQIDLIYEKNLDKAINRVNDIAPEHIEIMLKKYDLKRIKHAGAIFVGNLTPVAFGDYFLGPSHSLPTNGCARFQSGLSVSTFLKRSAVMSVNKKYILKNKKKTAEFAELEGMNYHAKSIKIRK